jgi:dTMP kinase
MIGDLTPDLTFILDVPAEVGLARAGKRRGEGAADRFEAESRAFHEALRDAYRRLALDEPARCVVIDATQPKAAVAERIWLTVRERFDLASAAALPAGATS